MQVFTCRDQAFFVELWLTAQITLDSFIVFLIFKIRPFLNLSFHKCTVMVFTLTQSLMTGDKRVPPSSPCQPHVLLDIVHQEAT